MTALREFQDFGNRCLFGRSIGGRFLLAPHDGLPDTPGRNTRYGGELYLTARLRQAEVASGRNDISPSSICHNALVCSPRSIQPLRVGLPIPSPLNAAVASTPALPGPASLRSPMRSPHPVSRSPGLAGHPLSLRDVPGIRSRLHLPPSSFSPCRFVAAEPRSGNVLLRVRGLRSGCGRTAVLGGTSRLSARLAPVARPSAGDLNSVFSFVGAFSWVQLNRSESLQQIVRWQSLANSGRILPNPYGSRSSAAICGGRTLPRNWNSRSRETVSNAATAPAEPGHRAIVRRPSSSCWCCLPITSSAAARSNTSCAIATRRTGAASKPRGSMLRSFAEPSTKSQTEIEFTVRRGTSGTLFRCGEVRACGDARLGRAETIAGGAASAGHDAAGLISNGSPGAPLARCEALS